jgi:hypothetical protein
MEDYVDVTRVLTELSAWSLQEADLLLKAITGNECWPNVYNID